MAKRTMPIQGVFDTDLGMLVGLAPEGQSDVTYLKGYENQASVPGDGLSGAASIAAKAGKRLVIWGDSTAAQNAPINSGFQVLGNAWVQKSLYVAGNPLDVVAIGGNSGLRTDQIIPTFAAQVAANTPDFVILPVCTNDLLQSIDGAVAISNLMQMAALVESIGAVPILCTLFPGDTWASTAANRAAWKAHNAAVLAAGVLKGFPVLDASAAFAISPGEPDSLPGTNDGVHPNNLGCEYISRAGGVFFSRWPRRAIYRPGSAGNVVSNTLMTGTTGSKQTGVTGSVPDGCIATVVTPGAVSSVFPRTDGGAGRWWQMDSVMNSGTGSLMYMATTTMAAAGVAVGDTFRASVDVEVLDGHTGIHGVQLVASFSGGSPSSASSNTDATNNGTAFAPGGKRMQLRTPDVVIPAGTTSISLYLSINPITGQQGSLSIRVGAPSAYKV